MWQTMTEDIDAISIGLRRRLTLPDVPLAADRPPFWHMCARDNEQQLNVRYWLKADIPSCTAHVRFRGVKQTTLRRSCREGSTTYDCTRARIALMREEDR
jgi:hypothetical protein